MREVVNFFKQLKRDENGASLIEYTVLLAILLVAVIAVITGVGGWILNQWSNLNTALPYLGTTPRLREMSRSLMHLSGAALVGVDDTQPS